MSAPWFAPMNKGVGSARDPYKVTPEMRLMQECICPLLPSHPSRITAKFAFGAGHNTHSQHGTLNENNVALLCNNIKGRE